MLVNSRIIMTCLVTLGLTAGSFAQDEAERKPLFGETHIHTAYSFDAYLFNTRATPDDAYNFGKGKPLKHPLGTTHQLKRPLDFMAVTDHGFFMGSMVKMTDESHRLSKHPLAAIVNDPDPAVRGCASHLIDRVVFMRLRSTRIDDEVRPREATRRAVRLVKLDLILAVPSVFL